MNCRHCGAELEVPFLDLGSAPPSNAYLTAEALRGPETWYPLRVLACKNCWLVQTEDFAGREQLFTDDYAYFSSYSSTWLAHARAYVTEMINRFDLGQGSRVVEVAANDGYLLQYVREAEIPCYGVEPTAGTAAAARKKGISIIERFFGVELASELAGEGRRADLAVANNVLAHVPDINEFVSGFAVLLKDSGVATFEFPHLLRLVNDNQFDTVYHEHYSYLSFSTVCRIFNDNGLSVFDVTELSTHGGSLRVFAQRTDTGRRQVSDTVDRLLSQERAAGIHDERFYSGFQGKAEKVKNEFLGFLVAAKRQGKTVAAYGAAAKGNTLLNFAGVRPDLLQFVVDKNPAKQDMFLPGSRIPIVSDGVIWARKPDYIVILPWNIKGEIVAQLEGVRDWGGEFVVAVPGLEVI